MSSPELEDETIDDGHHKSKSRVDEVHQDTSGVPQRSCELQPAVLGWRKEILKVGPGIKSISHKHLLCNSHDFHSLEIFFTSKAAQILKAFTEDADAAKNSDNTADHAEEDEADLDELEHIFVTANILTEYSVADHEVAKQGNSNRHQAVPSIVFKC